MRNTFTNEPLLDFGDEGVRAAMKAAFRGLRAEAGRSYGCVIAGEEITRGPVFATTNPNDPSEVLGAFHQADEEVLERAMVVAGLAFEPWKQLPGAARARVLMRAARIMRRRRVEIDACMVLEVGMNLQRNF